MNAGVHVAASAIIGAGCYAATKSVEYGVVSALSGIFIDLDHLFEYWLDKGFNLSIKNFLNYSAKEEFTRYFLFLHSIEILLLLLVLAGVHGFKSIYAAAAIGMGSHIILDYINIVLNLGFKLKSAILFSFFYRARHRFQKLRIDSHIRCIQPEHILSND